MRGQTRHTAVCGSGGGGGGVRWESSDQEKLREDREREFFHQKLTKSEKAVCPGKVFLIEKNMYTIQGKHIFVCLREAVD